MGSCAKLELQSHYLNRKHHMINPDGRTRLQVCKIAYIDAIGYIYIYDRIWRLIHCKTLHTRERHSICFHACLDCSQLIWTGQCCVKLRVEFWRVRCFVGISLINTCTSLWNLYPLIDNCVRSMAFNWQYLLTTGKTLGCGNSKGSNTRTQGLCLVVGLFLPNIYTHGIARIFMILWSKTHVTWYLSNKFASSEHRKCTDFTFDILPFYISHKNTPVQKSFSSCKDVVS